ncbi:hypothetical protein NC797_16470 [Aquibacillus sp. 3ASR75-11]|uniref:Uncharacterized protein n=1 Tax=Terrihalobacillus insolitus TaxID=2950438 RepID=A0A9X3WXP9_9BACI|nr:hypothetical protein [Terrihalobacillus insolitus]MDC3415099.1 hypothetical protein [Terrihalobacillus insolitus]MDC3426096.1 hypothetical protein [Terrihalobacillus insolitus]
MFLNPAVIPMAIIIILDIKDIMRLKRNTFQKTRHVANVMHKYRQDPSFVWNVVKRLKRQHFASAAVKHYQQMRNFVRNVEPKRTIEYHVVKTF